MLVRGWAEVAPLQVQKRPVLALPVLYRSGAPEEIRTPDPQIRSLFHRISACLRAIRSDTI